MSFDCPTNKYINHRISFDNFGLLLKEFDKNSLYYRNIHLKYPFILA